MGNLRRFRGGLRRPISAFLVVLSCTWLALYVDSVYQRRKAERFLTDLKSFPFASAGFVEVRDLATRNGGFGLQELPQRIPFSCTIRDCTFEVWIRHPLLQLSLRAPAWEMLYSTLPYFGIRPWVVYSRLEVKDGKLLWSITQIGQLRRGRLNSYKGLLPINYEVRTDREQSIDGGAAGYTVGPPSAITGPFEELWIAHVPQVPDAPVSRAFDADLHCFTSILHGCTGFRELAPSAWADNQANQNR
jgi:hypothetical protein